MGAICGLMMTSMFCMLFPGPFMQKIVAGMGSILLEKGNQKLVALLGLEMRKTAIDK